MTIRDASDEPAVIGLWGPAAREILQATTDDDVSAAAFPFRTAREIRVGAGAAARAADHLRRRARLRALRRAALGRAGLRPADRRRAPHGLEPCGYRSLEGLRMEKGYRYYGTDLTPGDTPDEAGLGVLRRHGDRRSPGARRWPPGASSRRCAASARCSSAAASTARSTAARPCTTTAPWSAGCAARRTASRSDATSPTPTCRSRSQPGDTVGVEIFGELVEAEVADDVQYDPGNERVRA